MGKRAPKQMHLLMNNDTELVKVYCNLTGIAKWLCRHGSKDAELFPGKFIHSYCKDDELTVWAKQHSHFSCHPLNYFINHS